jgi:hypothetical protein
MNESEFERELRALQPAPVSETLRTRVGEALQERAASHPRSGVLTRTRGEHHAIWRVVTRFAMATCAGLIAAAGISALRHGAPRIDSAAAVAQETVSPGFLLPFNWSQEVLEAGEEELFFEEMQPARLVRLRSLERQTWSNPDSGALIAIEVPREDVFVVPVAMQ